jgi:hypothetical protein
MSRWFRHYAGMMRDEKLVSAAVKSKQPVERVVWVWGAVLESASEINDGGRYEFDCGEAAYFLRCSEDDVASIIVVLEALGRLGNGIIVQWSARQYESDKSTERVRKHRSRVADRHSAASDQMGNNERNDAETLHHVSVTPPETDTDTDVVLSPRGAELEAKLRTAAGWEQKPHPNLFVTGPVEALMTAGCDLEQDVLPVIRRDAPRCRSPNWKFFLPAIAQARDDRIAAGNLKFEGKPHAPNTRTPNTIANGFALVDASIAALQRREDAERERQRQPDSEGLPRLRQIPA